jgi:predicted O-methyltransferase YrrM
MSMASTGQSRPPRPEMNLATWTAVDDYFGETLFPGDDAMDEAQRRSAAGGLPAVSVSAAQGKLLHLLARSIGARRILEIGTLGGYSTIWLARAIRSPGVLITLELNPHHAQVARSNLDRAGLGDLVDIRVGPAAESLAALAGAGPEPFDLVFIDADKKSNSVYFDYAVRLGRPGTVIVVDNVVRGGRVADGVSRDEASLGVHELVTALAGRQGVEATAIQTVGTKGYDGFILALVGDGAPDNRNSGAYSPAHPSR